MITVGGGDTEWDSVSSCSTNSHTPPSEFSNACASDMSVEELAKEVPPKTLKQGGFGPPLYVGIGGKRRPFVDGAGLCSPGCWPPEARKLGGLDDLRRRLFNVVQEFKLPQLLSACRHDNTEPPSIEFPPTAVEAALAELTAFFRDRGSQTVCLDITSRQPFRLHVIEAMQSVCLWALHGQSKSVAPSNPRSRGEPSVLTVSLGAWLPQSWARVASLRSLPSV